MYTLEDKKQNIEMVLDKALEYCEECGIENIVQAELARRTNLSVKSIKRYFKTKTELIFRVSEKLIEGWYQEIDVLFQKETDEAMLGVDLLMTFLKVHNRYLLSDYKGLMFIQNADIHCRYNFENPSAYLDKFRRTDKLEDAVQSLVDIGIKDKSIKKEVTIAYSSRMITTLCSGLVEHLASFIHCDAMTMEEAAEMSDNWVEQLILYLKQYGKKD